VILSANLGVSLNAPKRVFSYRLITRGKNSFKDLENYRRHCCEVAGNITKPGLTEHRLNILDHLGKVANLLRPADGNFRSSHSSTWTMKFCGQNFYCKSAPYKGAVKKSFPEFWQSTLLRPIFATPILNDRLGNSEGWLPVILITNYWRPQ
jgi:hypothetical protein